MSTCEDSVAVFELVEWGGNKIVLHHYRENCLSIMWYYTHAYGTLSLYMYKL